MTFQLSNYFQKVRFCWSCCLDGGVLSSVLLSPTHPPRNLFAHLCMLKHIQKHMHILTHHVCIYKRLLITIILYSKTTNMILLFAYNVWFLFGLGYVGGGVLSCVAHELWIITRAWRWRIYNDWYMTHLKCHARKQIYCCFRRVLYFWHKQVSKKQLLTYFDTD